MDTGGNSATTQLSRSQNGQVGTRDCKRTAAAYLGGWTESAPQTSPTIQTPGADPLARPSDSSRPGALPRSRAHEGRPCPLLRADRGMDSSASARSTTDASSLSGRLSELFLSETRQ